MPVSCVYCYGQVYIYAMENLNRIYFLRLLVQDQSFTGAPPLAPPLAPR
jgi:hypothetical protein